MNYLHFKIIVILFKFVNVSGCKLIAVLSLNNIKDMGFFFFQKEDSAPVFNYLVNLIGFSTLFLAIFILLKASHCTYAQISYY
jgi:amino acid permease